jgi:ABC-type branched-subunit amino acid transport system substrate-binding protein
LGGSVNVQEFSANATDLRTPLLNLKKLKPDALFVDVQSSASADKILKQLSQLGWKPKLLVTDAVAGNAQLISSDKVILEGALFANFSPSGDNPKFQKLLAAYKSAYDDDLPNQTYGATEYDAAYIIRDAIMAVGNDGAKIASWLHSVNGSPGASGDITISTDGDRHNAYVPQMIKNGSTTPYSN